VPERRGDRQRALELRAIWGSWASVLLVTSVIWAITDFGGYYWPIWVAGPWGALLLARTLFGGRPDHPGRQPGERDHRGGR
jgi:hypothetical protein